MAVVEDKRSIWDTINEDVVKPYYRDAGLPGSTLDTLSSMDRLAVISRKIWPYGDDNGTSFLRLSIVVAHVKLLLWEDLGMDERLKSLPTFALHLGKELLNSPLEVAVNFHKIMQSSDYSVGVLAALQSARGQATKCGGVELYPYISEIRQFRSLPNRNRVNPFETFSAQVAQYKDDIFELWHTNPRTRGFTPPGGNNRLATYLRSLRGEGGDSGPLSRGVKDTGSVDVGAKPTEVSLTSDSSEDIEAAKAMEKAVFPLFRVDENGKVTEIIGNISGEDHAAQGIDKAYRDALHGVRVQGLSPSEARRNEEMGKLSLNERHDKVTSELREYHKTGRLPEGFSDAHTFMRGYHTVMAEVRNRAAGDSPLGPFFKPYTIENNKGSIERLREALDRKIEKAKEENIGHNSTYSLDGEFLNTYVDQIGHTQKVKEDEAMATPTTQDPNKDQKTTGLVAQTKSDVSAAAKRVAVNRVVRLVREPLVAFLAVRIADSGDEGEKTEEEIEKETQSLRIKISAFLKSDEGEAVVKYLIAKGWELVRTWVPEDLHWVGDVIAEELRIQAWTVGIDKVADLVTESIVPQLRNLGTVMGSMAFSPPSVSEKKPTLAEKVRVSTGERTVNPLQAVQEANEAAMEAPRVHRARGF